MIRATALALVAAIVLVVAYVALGGGDALDAPAPPDACARPAQAGAGGGLDRGVERVALSALTGAACELRISRERLVLAIGGVRSLPPGITEERREQALRGGVRRALDEEQRAGRISPAQASVLRSAAELLPIDAVLDQLLGR